MSLPSFLCIGAQKAGTTWLFDKLGRHPQMWMPPVKELHYFDHLFVERNRQWTLWHIRTGVRRAIRWHVSNAEEFDLQHMRYLARLATVDVFTERWYRFAFEHRAAYGRVTGDITPEYSTIPEAGIAYVRRLLGAVKIIYIIRDPVDRALSQIRMAAMRRSITEADESEWLKIANEPDIENRGAYSVYIPRWRTAFAGEDLLFIPFQRIAADPLAVLREVERFIGVGEHEYEGLRRRVHATAPIGVPDAVKTHLAERLGPERRFIEASFGHEFAALI